MAGLKYYERTMRLLELIEKGKTGSPKDLARKFGVTERTVYNILDSVKVSFRRRIVYSERDRSYVFEDSGTLN
ncbi:MAG: HTH domain-containing protein [Lunatimonas sp.]|uniref:HTH domain-containing protein n=1 Tax=Lunatimonas sp. TaxID=2060141 RepID=UPI00263B2762|nr:HTH domain-containing protein [Lunatimonas sp.]MCC5939138.1 HTH domain-containing protein [Lunatimonas sp.]